MDFKTTLPREGAVFSFQTSLQDKPFGSNHSYLREKELVVFSFFEDHSRVQDAVEMHMVAVGTFEHIWLARLVQPLNLERLGYCENVVGAQAKEKSAYTINGKFGSLQTMISKMLTNFSTKSKSPVDPLKRLPILIWNECLPIFNTKKKNNNQNKTLAIFKQPPAGNSGARDITCNSQLTMRRYTSEWEAHVGRSN